MNSHNFLALLLLSFAVVFFSCEEEERLNPIDNTASDSTVNALIFHEGGFGSNNATIGRYHISSQNYNPAAFRQENGNFIGDVQQNARPYQGKIYSILNGSNAIKVMDSANLTLEFTIEDPLLDKPRDIAFVGSLAYVTVWGAYNQDFTLGDSKVLEIDLISNRVLSNIPTEEGVENIAVAGNKLLATRNYFGSYQHLTIVNLNSLEVSKDLELPAGPQEILIDEEGTPWVICTSGAIVKIDMTNETIAETYMLEAPIFGEAEISEGLIYFLQNNQIKAFDTSTGQSSTLFATAELAIPYGIGFDAMRNEFYLADGVDYAGEGKVLIYSAEGDLRDEFTSGILPTDFIFQTGTSQSEKPLSK